MLHCLVQEIVAVEKGIGVILLACIRSVRLGRWQLLLLPEGSTFFLFLVPLNSAIAAADDLDRYDVVLLIERATLPSWRR